MNVQVDLQLASDLVTERIPDVSLFEDWVNATVVQQALASPSQPELTVRVVNETEVSELNNRYRHKQGATNVLSFPFAAPPGIDLPLLGDVVICQPVVEREARAQHKSLEAHWAHLVVHGVLHLLGYDHLNDRDAEEMEGLEITILQQLGYPNPYQIPDNNERRTNDSRG